MQQYKPMKKYCACFRNKKINCHAGQNSVKEKKQNKKEFFIVFSFILHNSN